MYPQVISSICESLDKFPQAEFALGPATFRFGYTNWVSIFSSPTAKVAALFGRDSISFSNLQKAQLPNNIEIGLSHDASLYLRDSKWLETIKAAARDEYVLVAFRHDSEMKTSIPTVSELAYKIKLAERFCSGQYSSVTEITWTDNILALLPKKPFKKINHWIQKHARLRRMSIAIKLANPKLLLKAVDVAELAFESFVEMIRDAKEIHTDRLHTMLLGAMLGKPVFVYETAYQKLESVYEQSLKDKTNITFVSYCFGKSVKKPRLRGL